MASPPHGRRARRDDARPASPASRTGAAHPPTEDLAALFRRYGVWLRHKLRRLYGAEVAEDLVQDVFLRAARAAATERVARHPKAFLLQVARRAAIDQSRRVAFRMSRQAVALSSVDAEGFAQSAEAEELLLLKQVILGMPKLYRETFVLNRFAGLSYAEIAGRFDISIKTVEWRMSQALIYCARAMADR